MHNISQAGNILKFNGDTMNINWLITRKCNYTCSYCSAYDNNTQFESFETIKQTIDQIQQLNKKQYSFSINGGEPTIYPRFIETLEYIFEVLGENSTINTITNLSKSKAFYEKLINRLHIHRKNFVFDTSYHFEFANFEQFITNCKLLSENQFKVSVGIMAHPERMEEVKQLVNTLDKIKNSYLTYKVKNIRQKDQQIDSRYSKQDLDWLQQFYNEVESKPIKVVFDNQVKYYSAPQIVANNMHHFKSMVCEAGVHNFSIDSDGTIDKAVCFRNKGGSKNIYKDSDALSEIGSTPVLCPHQSCGCLADIPIPKYTDNSQKHKVFDSYLHSLQKTIAQHKIAFSKEDFEKTIEKEMTKFYADKEYFYNLYLLFKESGLDEFATKAQSLYFAHKAVQFRDMLVSSSKDEIRQKYSELYNMFEKSIAKQVFQHYIFTHALLNDVDVTNDSTESSFDLTQYLQKIGWESKLFLYNKLVKDVVKLNTKKTNASVVIISNGNEKYIIETLEEIARQKNDDYKIIFVSNNATNQTQKVVDLVDTFVQMKENNGAYLARNVGSIFAMSDLLIFLEDDGIPEKQFVKAHEQCHEDEEIVAVRGCYLSKTNGNMPAHYWLGMKSKPALTMLEGNCSFKARQFYEVGGWGDYIMFGHGGKEICHRMLHMSSLPENHIYTPKAILYHDFNTEKKAFTDKYNVQYASWQVLKFSYEDFHTIMKKWQKE